MSRYTYLLLILILGSEISHAAEVPVAIKGVLDLRAYDFETNGPVDLSGDWLLYWNHLLLEDFERFKNEKIMIQVPGSWNQYKRHGIPVNRTGFATYRLTILLPSGIKQLGFKIHDVFSSSAYYINGEKFASVGFFATNRYQSVIRTREHFVETSVNTYQLDLVVHVSNYEHRDGGIRGGITMGLPNQIESASDRQLNLDYFLMGVFMIIGMYFISLFLVGFEQYRFYFAMICLLMVFRIAVTDEMISQNMNSIARFRLEYLSFYLIVPFFILMIRSLFPIEFNRLAFRILMWISVVFVLIVLFTPLNVFSYTLQFYQFYFTAVAAVIIIVLITACKRGRSNAIAFAIGMTILNIGVINDLLYATNIIETGNISQFTMFFFVVINAHIFSANSLRMVKRTESLSREIQMINENLETLVEERTYELRESTERIELQRRELEIFNKNLSEAVTSRNRMFSIIGHDIRGPIGYIRQGLELLVEEKQIEKKDHMEMLRLMAVTAHKTFDLLENLMLWGRTQVGNLEPKPQQVTLKSVIEECLEVMDLGIREKSLILEVDVDKNHAAWIDRDQLLIVIRNLLSNAIKFTPSNGHILIRVTESEKSDEIILEVRDTGIGIPKNLQAKLFDPEQNYTTDGTNHEKGSGLGLKRCREIILANNGWIRFESKSGKGSLFIIGMPIKSPKDSSPQ